jgi:hypothetical protein
MRQMIRFGCVVALGLWWAVGSPAAAQQWAKDMFAKTSHDFGTLARGAKAQFAFTFENIYLEDVHIEKVQTTCGCASVKYPTEWIKTYQKKSVVAIVDTRTFLGRKDVTLTVKLDKPFPAEVPLHIHCYIRGDVVFQPGSIQFGSVKQGQGARRKTTVSYAGRNDWAITSVRSPHPFIIATPTEISRSLGRVTYDLWVELKPDAPPGYLSGYLVLHTNDVNPQKSQVPLAIEGVVESELTARPAALTMLAVRNGEPLRRNIVVQASRPFRVTEITCSDRRFRWELPKQKRPFHVIPVTFTPGPEAGKVHTTLQIKTDLAGVHALTISVDAEVAAAPPPQQPSHGGAAETGP